MEDAIQKTKHQIAEIKRQAKVQFEAYLAVYETVSESEGRTISEEQEVSPRLGSMFGKVTQWEELWPSAEEQDQLPQNRTKTSRDVDKSLQMDEEQASRQCEEVDTVPITHKRVETLRSLASGQAKPSASQGLLQREGWSLDDVLRQMGPRTYMGALLRAAVIKELLRENVEKQRVLLAGLEKCKEEVVKMQREIERDGEMNKEILEQWNEDVEAFLRAREVIDWRDGEEEGGGGRRR